MGTRTSEQNALLAFLRKFRKWILSFLVVVSFFEASLSYIDHTQQQNIWKSITTLLRNEVNSANSYQISRALSDMEQVGWIKCIKLFETTNESRIFYDTTTQSYCGFFAKKTEGILKSINGSTWKMSFASPENIWLLILRILIPFSVALGLFYIHHLFERQQKTQEAARLKVFLEKEHLFDLTKQTRHDIASPIGALKLVVQKIQTSPEYIELLKNITERIEGIFAQLRDINEAHSKGSSIELEIVQINKLVSNLILEKENQWCLPPGIITSNLPSIGVIANEVELGRSLSNLLNNAIEAKREESQLQINITGSFGDKFFTLKIQDNGIGMSPENLSRIGTKGFTSGKSNENSGIGLFHAIKTIHSLGGHFIVESNLGVGTTVTIQLMCDVS